MCTFVRQSDGQSVVPGGSPWLRPSGQMLELPVAVHSCAVEIRHKRRAEHVVAGG